MKTSIFASLGMMIFVGMAVLGLQPASASVIVSFNSPDYTTGNFAFMTGWTSGMSSVAFSDSAYRNPTSQYDLALPSAKFYGGATTTGAAGLTTYRVNNNAGADRITAASSTDGATVTQVVVWEQEDFLAFSSGEVTLNSSTSITFSLTGGASGRSTAARLLVVQGGNYYISGVAGTSAGTSTVSHTITDPTALTWYNYNPLSSMTTIGGSPVALSLKGVTGVGFWAQGTATATVSPSVSLTAITIHAVPEPASMALLGFGISGVLFLRRKRKEG